MNSMEKLIKQHIQPLAPAAQLRLLEPSDNGKKGEWQLYVLTSAKVDMTMEKQLLDLCYKIELETSESISMFVYTLNDWHKQFSRTPFYEKLMSQGKLL